VKLRKDIELLTVQHESAEASLRKRHQEAINELTDQIEQLSKHRNKCVHDALPSSCTLRHILLHYVAASLYSKLT